MVVKHLIYVGDIVISYIINKRYDEDCINYSFFWKIQT